MKDVDFVKYFPLVRKIANREVRSRKLNGCKAFYYDQDDAFQEGCLGLMKAFKLFVPEKENGASLTTFCYLHITWAIKDATGRIRYEWQNLSLDNNIDGYNDDDDFSLSDVLSDPDVDIEEDLHKKQIINFLYRCVVRLKEPHRIVIMGILNGKLQKEISVEMGCSCEKISNLEAQALNVLRMDIMKNGVRLDDL